MNIERYILEDPVNNWIFSNSKGAYLVGGYLRDVLRGQKSNDRDFVIENGIENIAYQTADRFGGTVIKFHKHHTYRVYLRDYGIVDVSKLTHSIIDDLKMRDFSVNALAWSPQKGLIDPDNYINDLRQGVIKIIGRKSLLEDPLRILRAYRLAAQLRFTIESSTRAQLKDFLPGINHVAKERISEELFKLLSLKNPFPYLEFCIKDDVISRLLHLTCRNYNIIKSSFLRFEGTLIQVKKYNDISHVLFSEYSQGLNRAGLVRLFILISGMNHYDSDKNKKFRPEYLENGLLILSRKILKGLINLNAAFELMTKRLSKKRLFEIFKRADDNVYESALIIMMNRKRALNYLKKAEDFITIKKHCLLNGNEIIEIVKEKPGRDVGLIKNQIMENQFCGGLRNKREAREWIISNLT